jgi:hypothetical protein
MYAANGSTFATYAYHQTYWRGNGQMQVRVGNANIATFNVGNSFQTDNATTYNSGNGFKELTSYSAFNDSWINRIIYIGVR